MRVLGIDNRIAFQRRPKKEEEEGLRNTIEKTYKALGTTDRIVITHGSCFPSQERNTYIGSPYGKAAKEYIKFLQLYGFNGNQLGPGGELETDDYEINPSPYNSSAFAKNTLFIDLEELTKEKYGKLLSEDTFKKLTYEQPKTNLSYDTTDFEEASHIYNIAMKEVYQNFKINLHKGQPQAIALNNEFQKFLEKNNERLADEGVFHVIAEKNGTDRISEWKNKLERNLISQLVNGDFEAINLYNKIYNENKKYIEQYKFSQFIATKQIKENKQWRDAKGFKFFNDLLVGCSNMDAWRYKDAFLDDYTIGAFDGSGNHQYWGIPAINPNKIFKGFDMQLDTGGQFLKEKIDSALEFCENIRIDHAMGLIEPFLIHKTKDGKLNGSYMSETIVNGKKLDDYYNYPRILEKIILPSLAEHGLKPKDPVWENICSNPKLFVDIYYNKLHLPELIQLEWSKAENRSNDNWFLIGSHDSIPAQNMLKRNWTRKSDAWNPLYLAGYLNQDPVRINKSKALCELIADTVNGEQKIGEELTKADRERVKAKFAELLTKEKFQISFADLLGITDITYNIGGTNNNTNWKERIPYNYQDKYYKNLSSANPTALNIPEVLKMALQARIDMKVAHSQNPKAERNRLYKEYSPLLKELQKYENILKEPE